MLSRLLGRKSRRSSAKGPEGSRAYAIGDVHGRLDLLRDLLARIEADDARRAPAKTWLVMLGDLVDRGPDSRGVVEHLLNHPPSFARTVYLKGNHEEFLLDVLGGDERVVLDWLTYGGYECAESYGVGKGWTLNATPAAIVERLAEAVPSDHKRFLASMHDSFRFGDYLFVHAGIRPGVPLESQTGNDLRWIRDGFLDDLSDHGVVVVHGHSIVDSVEERANRIAIDTGAYRTGLLTAIGIEGGDRWFIEARAEAPAYA
ncbi:metallophosphoesterase [Allosphingosinicella sp.]|uniref:metallophosphoesterase n=1 Tax=Allosphingosinicella sp. TaxID=2823234 RepID=UPI002EF6B14D